MSRRANEREEKPDWRRPTEMIPYWTYRGRECQDSLFSPFLCSTQWALKECTGNHRTTRRCKWFGPLRKAKIMQHRFTWQWYRKCTRTWCSIQKIVSSHPTIDGRSSNRIENKSRWNKAYVLIRCVHQWHPTKCIFEKKGKEDICGLLRWSN